MTVKKAAISIGDWLKSTGFSAEKTLASAQEQRKTCCSRWTTRMHRI